MQAQAQVFTHAQAQAQPQAQQQAQQQAQVQVQLQAHAQLQAGFMTDAERELQHERGRLDARGTNSFLASALSDPVAALATATGATALAIALGLGVVGRHPAERSPSEERISAARNGFTTRRRGRHRLA